MWHQGTWASAALGSAEGMVGFEGFSILKYSNPKFLQAKPSTFIQKNIWVWTVAIETSQ